MLMGKEPCQPTAIQSSREETDTPMETMEFEDTCADEFVVLDERVRAQLGRQLGAYYGELVKQPIPVAFIELLKKLDSKEKTE